MKATIFNIQKFCLHDGPGIRTTVFFKGCNLRCAWCANPESQKMRPQLTLDRHLCRGCGKCAQVCKNSARNNPSACVLCGACMEACPNGAIAQEGREMTPEQVLEEVLKDKAFYETSGGGVTFSGGEVLLQTEFAVELARLLHQQGIHVAAETAAAVRPDQFIPLLNAVDYIFIDLKHYDSRRHLKATGQGNEQIIENIRIARSSGKPMRIRIPVIPGCNASAEDAAAFSKLFVSMDIREVQLLPFHQLGEKKYSLLGRDYAYAGAKQLHREDLAEMITIFEKHGVHAET